jgi:putative DNA primase/helicase
MSPAVARSPQDEAVHESDGLKSVPRYVSFACYQMGTKGLFKIDGDDEQTDTEGGENAKSLFISGPFEVLGRARNPNGEGWGRVLRWSDDDKRPHTAIILDADLHGEPSALCADLASRGLKVVTGRTARAHLIAYLNEILVVDRVTIVERTGWHEVSSRKVFVLPDNPIGLIENESFIIQGSTTAPFATRETLADWQRGVGSFVVGHSRAVFAVSLGFAGPLLGLLGQEGCGFNLYGQSSRGKTTLAKAAASVWGKGDSPGFVRSWRSTANALEATAALHTDTLLVLDELSIVDPREAHAAAYQLTGGTGKGRAARDGSLRQSLTWRTIVLSTGEVRIADKLAENGQRARAGQQVRLIDVPADAVVGLGVFDNVGAEGEAKMLAEALQSPRKALMGRLGRNSCGALLPTAMTRWPTPSKP